MSPLGSLIGFGDLPWQFWPLLVVLVAAYLTMVELVKRWFDRREARRPDAIARQKTRTKLQVDSSSQSSGSVSAG
jgi:hypothetical protein